MNHEELATRPKVSIVIPCYNQGKYIKEALDSIIQCIDISYEVIIVNDGSTDEFTNRYLKELQDEGYIVIFQENMGLAGARNRGISLAKGEYILPLDADNKIRAALMTKGVQIMDKFKEVCVVYGNAQFFGEKNGSWISGAFNMQRLMIHNYIDACALIRKSVFDQIGLYDTKMPYMGWEDWELWLRIAFKGYQFHYIDETLFDYRVINHSMSRSSNGDYEKINAIDSYLNEKFSGKMGHQWILAHFLRRFKKTPVMFIVKLVICAYMPSYYKRLLDRNKIRSGI